MRFLKGSKVEVLQEADVPFGSWRPGEIVSGNGHAYFVRYDESPVDSSVAVERVPRRLMRPRPPADDPVRWSLGSIIEAFDSYSWKVAEVVRVLGKNQYLVRLLGSSLELSAHASVLRMRKLWLDDIWIVTQKYSARCLDGGAFRGQSKDKNLDHNFRMDSRQLENQNAFEGDTSRGIKRKSSAISTHPQCSEITKRLRTPNRDGRYSKLVDRSFSPLAEKGQGWRLVKHPSIGSCKWRSLPHVLQCDKCGNISNELPLVKLGQDWFQINTGCWIKWSN
ncbi:uncharacterized protein [Zea mays]|uniref:Plant Tudor-like RNA-binding protein n=1 Tax=Zea mays TaxID=4577 RepID=A0A1D6LSB5_MAIZE|nr:uncharacterized protein LOC103629786 isoform X5 [Zea mays]AQK82345.1 Plant Tudor-like RNA-binding protein [Zea mays]|eukprot:XP_008649115.1 uncharacterized protein LOC103629786 isoform X5 [Zea mays]